MNKNSKVKDMNEYKNKKKNKYKKKPRKKIKKVIKKNILIFTGAIGVLSIFIVNICGYAIISELKYEIGDLKKEKRKAEIRLEEARADFDTKTSIHEIEKRAREELNMDYPKKNQVRYIHVK